MNKAFFKSKDNYKVCFLTNKINLQDIRQYFLQDSVLEPEEVINIELYKDPSRKKTKASDMKEFLKDVIEELHSYSVKYVVICNSDYFKVFTKEAKAEANLGYVLEIEGFNVLYAPDFSSIFYDPNKVIDKFKRASKALENHIQGTYKAPGSIQFNAAYPKTPEEIKDYLDRLKTFDKLTCDIETFSLRPHTAGIASIGFAVNQHEGIAFQVDPEPEIKNLAVRELLKDFFKSYQGTLIFHNIAFDATVLNYQLWMNDIANTQGCLEGISYLLKNFDDTKLIAYLATNSCAGNELGLKVLAQEFAGNYAQEEIDDVRKIELKVLLEYNVIDCLSTWFVYDKYYPLMQKDNQENIYKNLFKPATKDIVQMQLTGFPLDMNRVLEVEKILQADMDDAITPLAQNQHIKNFTTLLAQEWVDKKNKTLKKKKVTIEDAKVSFNPRSSLQLQKLLYQTLKLPVLDKTDSGAPSTDGDTIKALINHTDDDSIKEILVALNDFSAVDKILTAFIPAFKDAVYSPSTKWHYLIGSFNLGGTVSGRLSSSKPNLQQLPATGSKYAKIIKYCFRAPPGWLLCGLDFNALEDHISALLTKDKNKLKVYLEHFDGHSLRANSYFSDKMPDIQAELEEINKEGKVFKVTLDSGEVKYYNEYNPEFIQLRNSNALH